MSTNSYYTFYYFLKIVSMVSYIIKHQVLSAVKVSYIVAENHYRREKIEPSSTSVKDIN